MQAESNASPNPMANGPVMVTGGCGFVGATLVSRLLADGIEVVVLDDQRLGRSENILGASGAEDRLSFATVSLEDPVASREALEQHAPRVVFHLAARHFIPDCNRDPHAAVATNVAGTQSLLDACLAQEGIEAVIMASSAAVYTPGPGPHREDDPTDPTDIYGLTKLWNEQQGALFHRSGESSPGLGIARLFNVYGPGETNEHLIPAIIRQGSSGGPLRLGNLDTRRDYVFVDDVADALLSFPVAVAGGRLETCNIGSGRSHDGHEVVRAIGEVLERELEVEVDPARLRRSDRPDLLSDRSRAEELLGWTPKTGFAEGLAKAAALPLAPASV